MPITKETLKKFAVYEISGDIFNDDYSFEDSYEMTLDDFKTVVRKIEANKDQSYDQFWEDWVGWIIDDEVAKHLCIDDVVFGSWLPESGLIRNERELIGYLIDALDHYCNDFYTIDQSLNFEEIREVLADYEINQSKPLTEWEFPDRIKEIFIKYVDQNVNTPEKISEDELVLFKRYIDELIEKDNVNALDIKGYLCYGGSPFYDCDWYTSRDCITRAFELTADAQYANTLGYIYYYGRCNNGVPEYEKAFNYYVFGHVNNWYESSYKLADMYRSGKGVIKSEKTYEEMIKELYYHAYRDFCMDSSLKLADVALRMGSIYEEHHPHSAYHYYLIADYVMKKRLPFHEYGDAKVSQSINEALDRVKEKVDHKSQKTITYENAGYIRNALAYNGVCKAKVKQLSNGYKMSITRITRNEPEKMLIAIPECDFCTLTDELVLYFDGERPSKLPDEFVFNNVYNSYASNNGDVSIFKFGDDIVAMAGVKYKVKLKHSKYDTATEFIYLEDDKLI
ncbi:MAG: hypothetical protein IJG49_04880 [Erysipelotrichaceae bacterium]|nr:hypothetical protein [Erysipelotrichaceae bacterium]